MANAYGKSNFIGQGHQIIASLIVCETFFKDTSWIDVSVSQKKGQEAKVQLDRHRRRGRNSMLPIPGQQKPPKKLTQLLANPPPIHGG
jgi:hypothetical protein